MTGVQIRLKSAEQLISSDPRSTPADVYCWKQLVHHVDVGVFERTGKIIVDDLTPESIAQESGRRRMHYDSDEVRGALERLKKRGRLSMEEDRKRRRVRYRLFLDEPEEPDYASSEAELWLYGPMS